MMVLCFFTEIQHKKSLAPQAKDFFSLLMWLKLHLTPAVQGY